VLAFEGSKGLVDAECQLLMEANDKASYQQTKAAE
jgi:hypothetical protein